MHGKYLLAFSAKVVCFFLLQVWDLNRGQMLQDLVCHKGAVLSCDVSSDGRLFATASADRTAKVSETGTNSYIRSISQDKIFFKVTELSLPLCLVPGL